MLIEGLGLGSGVADLEHFLVQGDQQRSEGHGQRNHDDELVGQRRVEHLRAGGNAEQHEGKLSALGDGEREVDRRAVAVAPQPCDDIEHQGLGRHQAKRQSNQQKRLLYDQAQIDRHADGDEEQAQQQALERLDVGFQFVAVFRIGQQHAGEKRAQRHRQAGLLHEQGGAHHHQQGGGDEHFVAVGGGRQAQIGTQQQAPDEDDRQHHGRCARRAGPVPALVVGAGAEQGQDGQQRNRGQVLEQQDGKRGTAVVGGELLSLRQHLQRQRGGRERQRQPGHERSSG